METLKLRKISLIAATIILASTAFMRVASATPTNNGIIVAPDNREVILHMDEAFIPSGFDSESESYVVVNGQFPNTCYEWAGAKVESDGELGHAIQAVGLLQEGVCLQMIVPFAEVVELGQLEAGVHTLKFVNGDGSFFQRTLEVEEAPETPREIVDDAE